MSFPKYLFFIMCLIAVIFVSYFISALFDIRLFSWQGYDFFSFGIVLSFIYFTEKNLRFTDSIITVLFLSILDVFFRKNTMLGTALSSFPFLLIYSGANYFLCLFVFHLVWFNKKFRLIRNIFFSILAGLSFSIVRYATQFFTEMQFEFTFLYYAFLVMLTISFAFTLAEVLFKRLEKIWTIPERIVHQDSENEKEE